MLRGGGLPELTRLVVDRYIGNGFLRKFVSTIYLIFTEYVASDSKINQSENLFLISFERVVREDHLKMFNYLHVELSKYIKIDYFEFNRKLNFSFNRIIKNIIICYESGLYSLLKNQMDYVYDSYELYNYKKAMVFCDVNPLMNYVCELLNRSSVKTYTLQHGFYASPENPIFRNVYQCTNASNFFVWDLDTKKWLTDFSRDRKQRLIHSGPLDYVKKKDTNQDFNDKISSFKKIAIYSSGKDQVEKNRYLVGLFKHLTKSDLFKNSKIAFICHPLFNIKDRFLNSKRYGIKFCPNYFKNRDYDLSIVLESSVWLELQARGDNFFILDDLYKKHCSYDSVISHITNGHSVNVTSSRSPFLRGEDVIEGILSEFK